jgi:hypothetical protein
MDAESHIIFSSGFSKHSAKARYLGRGRDDNSCEGRFERRFEEHEGEISLVEEEYPRRGILVVVSSNVPRTKE